MRCCFGRVYQIFVVFQQAVLSCNQFETTIMQHLCLKRLTGTQPTGFLFGTLALQLFKIVCLDSVLSSMLTEQWIARSSSGRGLSFRPLSFLLFPLVVIPCDIKRRHFGVSLNSEGHE